MVKNKLEGQGSKVKKKFNTSAKNMAKNQKKRQVSSILLDRII